MNIFSGKIKYYLLMSNSCNYLQKYVILFIVFFIIAGLNLFDYHKDVFTQVNASFSPTTNNSQQTQESLESTNRDAILSYEQGNKFLNAKDYDQAITSYKNAITMDPNWAAPLIKQGNSYFELANYTKAIESYDKAFIILGNLHEKVKTVDKINGPKPYWLDL